MEMTLSMKAVRLVFTIYLNLVLSTCISLQAPHILQVLRRVWISFKSSISFSFAQMGRILMFMDCLIAFTSIKISLHGLTKQDFTRAYLNKSDEDKRVGESELTEDAYH